MHKQLLNILELELSIFPNGPILIKSGTEDTTDPTLPNMNFVRGMNPVVGAETIYLPGSSLKGVIRSHAERIIRTVIGEKGCCDPLGDAACDRKEIFLTQSRREKPLNGSKVYQEICPACRMFGHTVMASRFFVPDAYPTRLGDVESLPIRQMVAIDRRSGGSVNTFTMEVATQGEFQTKIVMRNFERWQVGLLALVLRDLGLGRLGIGFGKSRGLGQVVVNFRKLTLVYPAALSTQGVDTYIYGLGELLAGTTDGQRMIQDYDLMPSGLPQTPDLPDSRRVSTEWAQVEVRLNEASDIAAALRSQVISWSNFARGRAQ